MLSWWRALIRTRIVSSPCWAPRVVFASGAWHGVMKLLFEILVWVPLLWWVMCHEVVNVRLLCVVVRVAVPLLLFSRLRCIGGGSDIGL
jgi:hypothetical protein